MTVSSEISQVSYDTDGVTTVFPVPFYFLANGHLRVWLFDEATGVETDLVLGSAYTVAGAGNPAGGSVTTVTVYPSGPQLRIERVVPITQETAYQRNDPFPERAHERALDKLTMICQQLAGFFGLLPGSTLRALLLGRNDVDGQGSYRARGNRIQDLADPAAPQDAVTRSWLDAAIAGVSDLAYTLYYQGRAYAEQLVAGVVGGYGWFLQRGIGAIGRPFQSKQREWVSILDFGGSPLKTSAENTAALMAAFEVAKVVLVPATEDGSEYRLTTPMALPYTLALFGDSTLVFDNAEWWRRGGSAGAGLQEKYTLLYEYSSQSDVSVTFDGVAQTITFPSPFTVLAPASTTSTAVRINIANGRLALGPSPEQARSFNVLNNGGDNIAPSLPDPLTSPVGMMNTSTGARALLNLTTGENNTAYGARALLSVTSGNNQTAFGFQTLYRSLGSDNTAFGSVAGEWLESGEQNVFVGGAAANHSISASYNTAVGWFAMGDNQTGNYNTCLGWRAGGNTGPDHSFSESVMVGAFAGSFSWGGKNTYMGYRAGTGLNSGSDGFENVAIGFFSMREHNGADMNVAVGVSALQQVVNGQQNVAIGHSAGNAILGNIKNTVVGYRAGVVVTGDGNTLVGADAAATTTTGTGNAALGSGTLATNVSGINNTAVGNNSGRLLQSGGGTVNLNNTTTVGFDARVSGSDQVQLGNGATTTYVYGTVQNRSDRRDKADIQDTALGLEFINLLRPVDYRWDMREDYIEVEEYTVDVEQEYAEPGTLLDANGQPFMVTNTRMVQEARVRVVHRERDGSKKRKRFHHGLLSHEVKEVADRLGIDFGGFQDHTVNGGCDVQSLGYDEFIAPLIRAVQELAARNEALAERVAMLEGRW